MALEEAFSYYQEAKDRDIKPNITSFNNILSLTAGLGEQGMGNGKHDSVYFH